MTPPVLYTIGHSTHPFKAFLGLLEQHGVTAIADVRSNPYSSWLPHFNRETLARELKRAGIHYVFLGEELGARRSEQECYDGTRVVYQQIAALPTFRTGLERLRRGAHFYRISLMCAEKEPLDCHRTILICRELRHEFTIQHILADGALENHAKTEQRLMRQSGISRSLFEADETGEMLIERAYDVRASQIAYSISETSYTNE